MTPYIETKNLESDITKRVNRLMNLYKLNNRDLKRVNLKVVNYLTKDTFKVDLNGVAKRMLFEDLKREAKNMPYTKVYVYLDGVYNHKCLVSDIFNAS